MTCNARHLAVGMDMTLTAGEGQVLVHAPQPVLFAACGGALQIQMRSRRNANLPTPGTHLTTGLQVIHSGCLRHQPSGQPCRRTGSRGGRRGGHTRATWQHSSAGVQGAQQASCQRSGSPEPVCRQARRQQAQARAQDECLADVNRPELGALA